MTTPSSGQRTAIEMAYVVSRTGHAEDFFLSACWPMPACGNRSTNRNGRCDRNSAGFVEVNPGPVT
jgi:hypothetical protein